MLNGIKIAQENENRKIWRREWRYQKLGRENDFSIPFEYKTTVWPDIEMFDVEEKDFRFKTEGYEVCLVLDVGMNHAIYIRTLGISLIWDAFQNKLHLNDQETYLHHQNGVIQLKITRKGTECRVQGGERELNIYDSGQYDLNVQIDTKCGNAGAFESENNGMLVWMEVCGIHTADEYKEEIISEETRRELVCKDKLFFKNDHYSIYYNHLEDEMYGKPDAYVISPEHIISAQRVTEEFQWRHNPMGDMTRVLNRGSEWKRESSREEFRISTGIPAVDAAFQIAMDVLDKAKSPQYAFEGEQGMWSAGAFQGTGMGFGVWCRDTMQMLLRGIGFIDPKVTRRTVEYILKSGKDNAVDGLAAVVISVWEYYLVSHDRELLLKNADTIKAKIQQCEKVFNEEKGLVYAAFCSSNDAYEDTEAGGYALSTEIYFMYAFECAFNILKCLGEPAEHYKFLAAQMLKMIRNKYWNPTAGIFTSGPNGSMAFKDEVWETAGEEGAVWNIWGIASEEQKNLIMDNLEHKIITPYGIPLMPGHLEKTHLARSVWTVYTTGYAVAAAELGKEELLVTLIAQQIRNAVFNKTFYEVYNADDGRAWRWPAQTWNAIGYISLLLSGVFGLKKDIEGIWFEGFIPTVLSGIRIFNLRYVNMCLDLSSEGEGKIVKMTLNGVEVKKIFWNLQGHHKVKLICRKED